MPEEHGVGGSIPPWGTKGVLMSANRKEDKPWDWMSRGNGGYFITHKGVEIGPDKLVELLNVLEHLLDNPFRSIRFGE